MQPAAAVAAPMKVVTFSVMINGLPPNVTVSELRSKYNERDFVVLPADRQKDKHLWCAYLNNLTEEQAKSFVDKWNQSTYINGYSIRCKLNDPANKKQAPSKHESPVQTHGPNLTPQESSRKTRNVALQGLSSLNSQKAPMMQQVPAKHFATNPIPSLMQLSNIFESSPLVAHNLSTTAGEAATTAAAKTRRTARKRTAKQVSHPKQPVPSFERASGASVVLATQDLQSRTSTPHWNIVGADIRSVGASSTRSSSPAASVCNTNTEPCYVFCKRFCTGSCSAVNCEYLHVSCDQKDACSDSQCWLGHPPNSQRKAPSSNDRNRQCKLFRTGECTYGNKCKAVHECCVDDSNCENDNCRLGHPFGWVPPSEIDSVNFCWDAEQCEDFDCQKKHPPERKRLCKYGAKCYSQQCEYLHPKPSVACDVNEQSEEDNTEQVDSKGLESKPTDDKSQARCNSQLERELGADCVDFSRTNVHPAQHPRPCNWGVNCYYRYCPFLHPAERVVCELGASCLSAECQAVHPRGRPAKCERGDACWYYNCELLHPNNWSRPQKP